MSTLTVQSCWEDERVRERTHYPPQSAEAKKMKSLTLHAYDCLRASLRACFSLLGHIYMHTVTVIIYVAPLYNDTVSMSGMYGNHT